MNELKETIQSIDLLDEDQIPLVEAPDVVRKGELFQIHIGTGKDFINPVKTEHHIRWIEVFFHPEGENIPFQIGRAELTTHKDPIRYEYTGSVFTNSELTFTMKTDKSGIIFSTGYCSIRGLWQNSRELKVV